MRHLQTAKLADLPRDKPAGIVLDSARPETRRVEEQQLDFARAVAKRRHEPGFAPAHDSRARNAANEHHLFAHAAVSDGRHLRLVEVGAGNVVQQVRDGVQPRLVERLYALGPKPR